MRTSRLISLWFKRVFFLRCDIGMPIPTISANIRNIVLVITRPRVRTQRPCFSDVTDESNSTAPVNTHLEVFLMTHTSHRLQLLYWIYFCLAFSIIVLKGI